MIVQGDTEADEYEERAKGWRRFNVEEFHRLRELRLLLPDDRPELLDGVIWIDGKRNPRQPRFSAEQFHLIAMVGVFSPDERVELVNGAIMELAPIGSWHQAGIDFLVNALAGVLGDRAIVRAQGPVRLDPHTELRPDLALLRSRSDYYRNGHPAPEDIYLVVEIADGPVVRDRGERAALYIRAGIPEVWVADLQGELVQAFRIVAESGRLTIDEYERGMTIAPRAFPHARLPVSAILG